MASSKRKNDDGPTVRAVLAYAAQLRERADAAKIKDPHVELYRPSNHVARTLSQRLGPEGALRELARRARVVELRYEEANKRAVEGRERLAHLQLVAAGERDADRARLTLGQRLDLALLELRVQSDVPAAVMDADVITGGKPEGGPPRSRRDRQLDDAVFDARRAVERLEREAAHHRRRLVELEVAA